MKKIYLDHTATTPVDGRVEEAMRPYFSGTFGNPSSIHSYGRAARQALEQARETIARTIGAQTGEVFFTSGGTEANNLAILGAVSAARERFPRPHVITSRAEHHAVLDPFMSLRDQGVDVTILPVEPHGAVSPASVAHAITDATCLVSIMAVNNEVGTCSPIVEIGSICREKHILFHSDAVQAFGRIPVNVDACSADLLTLSAHKLYGPKGIGALYIKKGTALNPVSLGGGQERGKRPGTENLPFAVGFARAAELAVEERETEGRRLRALRDGLAERLRALFPDILLNGDLDDGAPHILSISFDSASTPMEGELLVHNMDLEGIAVSSGSACTSGSLQPSHVLLAMGSDEQTARASIRFSFGRSNSEDDIPVVADALERVVARMRRG